MPKRFGDTGDFKPKKLDAIKPVGQGINNRANFSVPKREVEGEVTEVCSGVHVPKRFMDFLKKQGRHEGELVLYNADQIKNYLKQFERYERSLSILPSRITQDGNGKDRFWFCTDRSPNGFWEVYESTITTRLSLINPILTIVCIRPFSLNELVGIDTDAPGLIWVQKQGRLTVISPASGEGSLNPDFFIIGSRTSTDPPIIIEVTSEDDETFFDSLIIDTTATSRWYSQTDYDSNLVGVDANPARRVQSVSIYVPPHSHSMGVSVLNPLRVTWPTPSPNPEAIAAYVWQQNTTGTYTDVQTFGVSNVKDFTLSLNNWYRVLTNYSYYGNTSQSISDTFYYTDLGNIKSIAADDIWDSKTAYSQGKVLAPFTEFTIETRTEIDIWSSKTSYSSGSITNTFTEFSLETISATDWISSTSYSYLKSTFQTDPLGGVIIG